MYYFQNLLPNLNKIAQETQRDATFKVQTYYHYFKYLIAAYLFLFLIILIIFLIIFTKAKNKVFHQFWYNQPIYHKTIINSDYLFPWLRKPYVIEPNPPELNKWVNYNNINFIPVLDLNDDILKNIAEFLSNNYKTTNYDGFKYSTTSKHFHCSLINHNSPSYIGIYYKDNVIKGTITSHPLNIDIYENKKPIIIHDDPNYENVVNYVDNLCVDFEERKQDMAPSLIRTIYHKIRHTNFTTKIALFKRENFKSSYVVPLVSYETAIYNIENWFHKKIKIHDECKVLKVSSQNIHLLYAFMYNNKKDFFDIVIYPDMTNIIELLNNDIMFIYMLMRGDDICSVYFFKDATTLYNDKTTVECVASINAKQTHNFFVQGFYHVLENLHSSHHFNNLHFEVLGHNTILYKLLSKANTPFIISNTALVLYNYKYKEVDAKRVCMLG